MKKALITGIGGQDGSYMAELLLKKGYKVFGLVQKKDPNLKNIPSRVKILFGDLKDPGAISKAVKSSKPDEVYNFAGISDLKTAFEFPEQTMEVNYYGVGRLLDEVIKINPKAKFLQASSSEIFSASDGDLDENSERAWSTDNPYAKAKMMADRDFIQHYRKAKATFACSAILFNHESPRRPERFVTRKITSTLVKIKLGLAECLELGNLESRRDWGFAGDYVEAMWKMLQAKKPQDYVIATGKTHSIKEFIEIAIDILSMKISWRGEGIKTEGLDEMGRIIVKVNPDFYRPNEKYPKMGNPVRARKVLDWKPKVSFKQLIKTMVEDDLLNISKR